MRTFPPQQQSQKPASPDPARPDAATRAPAGRGQTVSHSQHPGHDFGRIPVLSPEPGRVAPDDSKEPAVPGIVREVLGSPGRPPDAATRAFFEPRFGHDFGHVRLHTDARAAESARRVDAQAYTVGRHVVFGPQAFRPESEHGRRLIAHELAHVVQQRGADNAVDVPVVKRVSRPGEQAEAEADAASAQALSGPRPTLAAAPEGGVLHRAPPNAKPAPARPFYQEAVDALAAERKGIVTIVESQMIPSSVPPLEKLVELCEAIDRGVVADVKTVLDEFLTMDTYFLPASTPSSSLVDEMVARMILLGMDSESERLRRWGAEREKRVSPAFSEGYAREIWALEGTEKRLLDQIPESGAAAGLKALDGLLLFFGQLVREAFSLDQGEIKKDQKRRADLYDNYFVQRDKTIAVYFSELLRFMRETFAGIQSAFQVVLDAAVEDLAAGRGGAALETAKERLNGRLQPLIEPADKTRQIGGVAVETTRSEFEEGGGSHLDMLAKTEAAQKKRSVKIHFYDAEQIPWMASEMSSDFGGVLAARQRQLTVIEEIYGLRKDDKGNPTAETKENAAALAALGAGGLRLHSDDDWRKFVLEKFNLREAASDPETALTAVMDLLRKYMHVFTVHTPYDIDDFGDNLLTKTFPRDLTGRLIHDCGVYGLRMAYILSLVRDHPKLRLRFRYVVLPVHVGLLITGDGLPTFLVNNDAITRFDASDVTQLRDVWEDLDEQGQPGTPKKAATEARFSGELMADEFLPGVDLPYKETDVVKPAGSTANIKAQMWQQYTGAIAPAADQLFGPSVKKKESPNYQFYLRYLNLLNLIKKHHNESLLPFWNDAAAKLWATHKPAITDAFAAWQKAAPDKRAEAEAAYKAAAKAYADALTKELAAVQQAAKPVDDERKAINDYIAVHPEVFAPGTEVESAKRVHAMFNAIGYGGAWWENVINRHLRDLLSGASVAAPFEKPEQKLPRIN